MPGPPCALCEDADGALADESAVSAARRRSGAGLRRAADRPGRGLLRAAPWSLVRRSGRGRDGGRARRPAASGCAADRDTAAPPNVAGGRGGHRPGRRAEHLAVPRLQRGVVGRHAAGGGRVRLRFRRDAADDGRRCRPHRARGLHDPPDGSRLSGHRAGGRGRRRLLVTIDELNVARTELADYAVIKERQRFSRDLHDLLGHSLSTIVVTAELAARSLRSDAAAAEQAFIDIETIGRTALGEVRSAVTGYRTMSFRDQLRAGREALRAAGIEVSVNARERCWSDGVDQVLSWTVRESITNILRHSHARKVLIALTVGPASVGPARLCLQVSDDGDAGETGLLRAEGGLRTLRERKAADRGTLDVTLGPEGGLRLAVYLPLTEVEA